MNGLAISVLDAHHRGRIGNSIKIAKMTKTIGFRGGPFCRAANRLVLKANILMSNFENGEILGIVQLRVHHCRHEKIGCDTLSTPGVFLPLFAVTRLTTNALPLNEWVSNHCKAFALLYLPTCVAFTIRVCSRLTCR